MERDRGRGGGGGEERSNLFARAGRVAGTLVEIVLCASEPLHLEFESGLAAIEDFLGLVQRFASLLALQRAPMHQPSSDSTERFRVHPARF